MLGSTTKSYDLETSIDKKYNVDHISSKELNEVKKSSYGITKQTPPIFSAIKRMAKGCIMYARKTKRF